ncbi:MAG: helix-turn-helix transcriptional regulator [Rickettsiales bacterium]|nr:helix-turn-helix transcriptional regulator [Rickettsiales bacterium]
MSQNYLKVIRKDQNIGQTELAELAGVSKQLIWGFENGRNGVSPQVLRKLAAVLKVTPNHILKGKDDTKVDQNDKDLLLKAMTTAHEFYKDYNFDHTMMAKITTELYSFMSDYKSLTAELGNNAFDKSLNDKIASGLAARCFLNIKEDK